MDGTFENHSDITFQYRLMSTVIMVIDGLIWNKRYWAVHKLAKLLLGHKLISGLRIHTRLHATQFHHVSNKNMNFQHI